MAYKLYKWGLQKPFSKWDDFLQGERVHIIPLGKQSQRLKLVPAGRADVTVPRRVNVIHFFWGIKLDANVAGNFEGFPKTCKCMTFGLVSYTDP